MRLLVALLFLMNVLFLLWNMVFYNYSHVKTDARLNDVAQLMKMPGKNISLVRENQSVGDVKSASNASADANVGRTDEVGECLIVGPYQDSARAVVMIARLESLGIISKYASIKMQSGFDYWVYIPPLSSRELAIAKLRELQDKKIDCFVIPEGEMANGISLGVFDSQDIAERHRSLIGAGGYNVEVKASPRSYLENWVVIDAGEVGKFSQELDAKLRLDDALIDIRKEACGKVASVVDIH